MTATTSQRLSMLQAAFVIARRDFNAILFSRSFFFFLLGPLFPAVIMLLAGGLGTVAAQNEAPPTIAVQMAAEDAAALQAAHEKAQAQLGAWRVPPLSVIEPVDGVDAANPTELLADASGNYSAVLSGSLEQPVLTATEDRLGAWQGVVSMQLALARNGAELSYPALETSTIATSGRNTKDQRKQTAQIAMTVLFMLMMLLAGMVLSNLVEEKANKIIEILAAALPMDAVFLGKLFAMLAISLVGVSVWFSLAGIAIAFAGDIGGLGTLIAGLPDPGVGWPLFALLFVVNFSMGYLLIGSIFLAIGALASTVREVQTLSMPVTMAQLFIFIFASFALVGGAFWIELAAILFPLSSPFAMTARAAQSELLWPHALAIAYQAFWVWIFIRWGARLFRSRVLKSGSGEHKAKLPIWKRLSQGAGAGRNTA